MQHVNGFSCGFDCYGLSEFDNAMSCLETLRFFKPFFIESVNGNICFNFKLFSSDFDDELLINKSCGSSNVKSVEDFLEEISQACLYR